MQDRSTQGDVGEVFIAKALPVSVVIPTHNRPQLVCRAIRSALLQSARALEIIVVVDGPGKATIDAIEALHEPAVRVIAVPDNVGGAEARNIGIRAAGAPWIALLDDDDEWLPLKLEKQLVLAQTLSDGRAIVACQYIDRFGDTEFVRPRRFPRTLSDISDFLYGEISLLGAMEGFPQTSTWLVSRELLLEVPFRKDLKRNQDTDWLLRAAQRPGIVLGFVREPLSIFNNEASRKRITQQPDWEDCRRWALENRHLFSRKALSSYLIVLPLNLASRPGLNPRVLIQILGDCVRHGALTPKTTWLMGLYGIAYPLMRTAISPQMRRKLVYHADKRLIRPLDEPEARGSSSTRPAVSAISTPPMNRVLIYRMDLLPPSETFILEQARALRRFQPRLIGLTPPEPASNILADAILLGQDRSLISRLRKRIYWKTGFAPSLNRRAAQFQAALIHAHFATDATVAVRLANALKLPLIVTLHGYDVTVQRDFEREYRELWDRTAIFVCVSEFIRKKALAAGFPETKLRVHYIGIDPSRFQPVAPAESKSVLFVGRLTEKKGCEYLIRAMALVQQEEPGATLTIVGDGPLRKDLEDLAATLGTRCSFAGAQPSETIRQRLGDARVFSVPSVTAANGDSEGLGTVFAEAQCMGIPIATTQHAGMGEIIEDGVTGLLAPERDVPALAANIVRLLRDEALWRSCRENGIENIHRRFDICKQTEKLEEIYLSAIAGESESRNYAIS